MKQPEFSAWPWGLLGATVPLMGVFGVAMAVRSHGIYESAASNRIILGTVFFSAIAAGNSYVMALATGDFGRSLLALPFGALIAIICINALSLDPVMVINIVVVGFVVARFVYNFASTHGEGGVISAISVAAGAVYSLVLFGMAFSDPWGILAAYPLVCGCVGASMATALERHAIFEAWLIGTEAGVLGMTIGAAAGGCALAASGILSNFALAPLAMALGAVVANVCFVKFAMSATLRVEAEA